MQKIEHNKQWAFLTEKHKINQLSHAYLFSGERGIGKKKFAVDFVEYLGCKFPDVNFITKKEDKTEIDISQIREAQKILSYKSYHGGWKALIIEDAELMNLEAQNCLLKTLEEPKGDAIIILISSKPDLFLQTILSRCQEIKFLRPKKADANQKEFIRKNDALNEFLLVAKASLAEKFKFVKFLNFEKENPIELLEAIQKHYRGELLKEINTGNYDKINKLKNILLLTEKIYNNLFFSNANPKLALEILLMKI